MPRPQTTTAPQPPRACLAGFLFFAALALPASGLDLNGFVPSPGQGTLAISYTSESYDEFWRGPTKVSNPGVGEVETRSTTAWLNWGFTRDLSLVANFAYVDADSDGLGGFEDSGAQDVAALVQYRFANFEAGSSRHSFLVAGGLRTPLSDYEANAPVSLGDGTTDGLFRFVYHLDHGRFYFSQQVGFDLRGGDAPNGFPLYTEIGASAGRLTATGFYTRYLADGGTDIGDLGFTFPSNRDEFERLGVKLYGQLTERLGLHLLGFTTLDGRNSGDASGLSFGGSFHF